MVVDGLIGAYEPKENGTFEISLRRRVRADPAEVWAAVSEPVGLARWFAPVVGEFRVGGAFRVTFREGGTAAGTIEACDAPLSMRVSWTMSGEPTGTLTVQLAPSDAGTILELRHSGVTATALLRNLAAWQTYVEQLDLALGGHDFPDWWDRYRHLRRRYEEAARPAAVLAERRA